MTGKLLIDWLKERQEQLSHRQLLLVSGDPKWCEQQASTLITQFDSPSLVLSNKPIFAKANDVDHKINQCVISQYKQHLGTEYHLVIYNAFDGLKPSALFAVEGAIGMSGLLVIMCPNLSSWPEYESKNQGIAFSYQTKNDQSLFIQRMITTFKKDDAFAIVTPHFNHLPFAFLKTKTKRKQTNVALTKEQVKAFSELPNSLLLENTIGLIRAKRGRGKSTLLGHLAFALATSNLSKSVYICAPHINNAQRAMFEYRKLVKSAQMKHQENSFELLPENIELKYIAPDQIYNLPQNSALFIDEAAAIAPSIVLYACENFAMTVMATTVAGYEGSGLGFNLRVLPKLESLALNAKCYELSMPLRWFDGDQLELLFEKVFAPFSDEETTTQRDLAQASIQEHKVLKTVHSSSTNFLSVDKNCLIDNERVLKQIFGLLIQSHYQTTPDDLMRILDAEDHSIYVLANLAELDHPRCYIEAVAVVVKEGNLHSDSDSEVLSGILNATRRVSGHLVPQNLASLVCDEWFMVAKSWRINRIAVSPELRRCGRGQELLQHIDLKARENEVDYLSTSFGLTRELFNFWQTQAYSLIKIGARRDTSSGEHSGIMIKAITVCANEKFSAINEILRNDMNYLLDHVIDDSALSDSASFIKELIKNYSGNDPKLHRKLTNSDFESSRSDKTKNLYRSTNRLSNEVDVHSTRIKQYIDDQRSFTNAAPSIYFILQEDPLNTLRPLFLSAHQKNRSKELKLETMSLLKKELMNILSS